MAGPTKAIFKSVRVVPHFGTGEVGGFDLYWEVTAPGFAPTFLVEEADDEVGPWTPLPIQPGGQNFLLDASTKVLTPGVVRWFRVTAKDGSTVLGMSPPMDHRNALSERDYLYYRELLRRWRLQLEKFSGSPGKVLRRRIYGEKCPKCTSQILQQSVSSDCQTCFGTALVGGYLPAVSMFAQWQDGPPNPATIVQAPSGPTKEQKNTILVFPVPDIKSDDVWVDSGTNYRYLVEAVTVPPKSDYRGSAVLYALTIVYQPPKNPIYNIPI